MIIQLFNQLVYIIMNRISKYAFAIFCAVSLLSIYVDEF